MIRLFAAAPTLVVLRAPEGSSGTLGEAIVGAHEIRLGSVPLDRLQNLPQGTLLGRGTAGTGAPEILTGGQTRALLNAGAPVLDLASAEEAAALSPSAATVRLRLQSHSPGGRGAAAYRRVQSAPEHNATFQTADGQWWTLDEARLSPEMFGAVGDRVADDGAAFAAMAEYVEAEFAAGRWLGGFGETASVIDLGGRSYVLGAAVQIKAPVTLRNGEILFKQSALAGDFGFALGNELEGESVTQYLENVQFGLAETLTANQPAALLYIPRTFATTLVAVNCNAGGGTFRARYGVYIGRSRAWSVSVLGGRFYGGDCPLRIGRENDHTGLTIAPAVCGHGRVMNLLVCNPAGALIQGRMEHSNGDHNVVITSDTNGVVHNAHAVTIHDGYMFNMNLVSGGNTGWTSTANAIMIGHDVPGTEGWDQAGVITSSATAEQIAIRSCYIVSDHIPTAIKARVLTGLDIDGVKWFTRGAITLTGVTGTITVGAKITGGASGATGKIRAIAGSRYFLSESTGNFSNGETVTATSGGTGTTDTSANYARPLLLDLSGGGANVRIGSVRNQNEGYLTPAVASSATNKPMWSAGGGEYTPALRGRTTAGTFTYDARGGLWKIEDGWITVSGFVNWTAASGGAGGMEITLPSLAVPRSKQRGVASISSAGLTYDVQGLVFSNTLRLRRQGMPDDISFADVGPAGNVHFAVSFPIETVTAP